MNVTRWLKSCKRVGEPPGSAATLIPTSLRWGLCVALMLIVGASSASANFDSSFDLTTPDSQHVTSGTLGSGPYATVEVKVINDTTATVTFTAKSGYGFVDGSSLALNLASGVTAGSPTINNGETLSLFVPKGKGGDNIDGFGSFNTIFDQSSANNPASQESVTLTGSGFLSATSLSTFLVLNGTNGYVAAAHVAYIVDGKQVDTGYAAGNGSGGTDPNTHPTPAPPSVVLLGIGGLALAGFMYRSRRRQLAGA